MTSGDRWKEISALFNAVLDQPEDQREAFLETACPDEQLRRQIAELLECLDPAAQYMAESAAQVLSAAAAADAADTGALVGRQLGAYRIDSLVDTGGMGRVYKATDTRLHRTVALKILPLALRGDAGFQERFQREARAIAALRHPHICVLHDIGREGDTQFLVMEYLEGETLASRLARGPLSVPEVLRYAMQIADALVEMHAHGIIHRDLKPANIMLTKSGAQLLDFGLARLEHSPHSSPDPDTAILPPVTQAGPGFGATSRAGTLAYMAPEQVRGDAIDHRADIFAFGAVLYEMTTGARAFSGADRAALAAAVLHDDPPAIQPALGAPPELETIVRTCLRKHSDERWQRTDALADALRSLASRGTARGRGRRTVRRAALVAALVVAAGLWLWRPSPPGSVPSGATVAAPTPLELRNLRMLTGDDTLEINPSLSPDGRSIIYIGGTVTRGNAFVRPFAGGASRAVNPEQASHNQPRWSPDGTKLLYLTLAGLWVAPATGGPARMIVARAPVADTRTDAAARISLSGAAWGPDSQRIAVADNSDRSISIVSLVDGLRRRIATSPDELHSCDWSPDGQWIACVAGNRPGHFVGLGFSFGNAAASAIVLVPAAGGPVQQITDYAAMNQSPVWSADSRRLYFVSNRARVFDIYVQEISSDGRATGPPAPLTTGLGAWTISFSADRRRLAYAATTARANIWSLRIPRSGIVNVSSANQLTNGNQTIESVRASRSGKWLVYDSNLHGSFDIFRMPIDGGAAERVTSDPGDEFVPDLAHDDRLLVYQQHDLTSRNLWVKNADEQQAVKITDFPGHEALPAWSPDGQSVAYIDFTADKGVLRGLFVISRDKRGRWSAPRHLRTGTWKANWSPDGRYLAAPRANTIEVISAETGDPRVVYAARPNSDDPKAEEVHFSDDGRTLYFKARNEKTQSQIWEVPTSGGTPRLIVEFGDRPSTRTDLGAGQGRFFFTIDERRSNIWVADVTVR